MLKESIKGLARDSLFYGISGSLSKFFTLATIPLLARILTKDQLGIYDVVTAVAPAFVGFVVLGQDSAIARYYYENEDISYRKKVISLGLYLQLALIILLSLVILVFGNDIGHLLFGKSTEYQYYWKLSLLIVPGQALVLFSQNIFKYTFTRVPYAIVTIGSAFVFAGLLLIFIYYTDYGMDGAILASVIAMNAFGCWGIWRNRRFLTLDLKKKDLKILAALVNYGLPFTGVMAIAMLMPVVDRFFLVRYVENPVIAEYSIAIKVAYFLSIFVTSFSIASGPYIFSVWHKKEAPKVFSKLLHLYIAATFYFALVILALRNFIISVMGGGNYPGAGKYLPMLLTSGFLEGLFIFSLVGIFWSKKAVYNFYVYAIGIVVTFILHYLLIPVYFVQGAVLSIVVAKVIMNITAFIVSNKYYKIDIEMWFITKCIMLTSLMVWGIYFNFWIGLATLLLFPVLFYYLMLTKVEAVALKEWVRSVMARHGLLAKTQRKGTQIR